MSKLNVQTIELKLTPLTVAFSHRDVSGTKSEVSGVIDASLTRNHHNCHGEEEDPGLARLLALANKVLSDAAGNESIGSGETFDLTTTTTEVPGTSRPTREDPLVIAPKNAQVVVEGDDVENEEGSAEENNASATESESVNASLAATSMSINARANRDETSSPMPVSARD